MDVTKMSDFQDASFDSVIDKGMEILYLFLFAFEVVSFLFYYHRNIGCNLGEHVLPFLCVNFVLTTIHF